MAKRFKFPFIFKNKENKETQQWQFLSCKHPKTLSFREGDNIFKTVNSVFFEPSDHGIETPETWFSNSSTSESASISTECDSYYNMNGGEESLEIIVKGVQSSERLFFEPEHTSSIAGELKEVDEEVLPFATALTGTETHLAVPSSVTDTFFQKRIRNDSHFEGSVVMAMESENPYKDFKKSMEEMIESSGLKDWEWLEELLGWYLRMNGENHHGFIIEAFIDLVIGFTASSSSELTSFFSSESCVSSPSSSLSIICQTQRNGL